MATQRPTFIIQNCPAESAGTTRDYLRLRQRPFREIVTYQGGALPDPDDIGAVINLGCPHPAARYHEHQYLKDLFSFVRQVAEKDLPYLGLCFGGQILALALGAEVTANPVKEIGVNDIRLTESGLRDPLFRGFDRSFQVFHWHGDSFGVPATARLLAYGEDCHNQVFVSGRVYAMIFHLE
ncbi:MAG: type 1 glutamine amidotransferase, partial [candidate division Zixibacteria bacterium]|nr:type 1 glutamine amidotransferase [candidate division Zixibacteria bacterium]